jgi:hypothetical protein
MVKLEKKSNTRFHIAIVLFLLAIATPLLLSVTASESEHYWAIARPVPSGSEISIDDLMKIGARVESNNHSYLTTEVNAIGSITTRSFLAGELIDVRFLTNSAQSNLEEVSIAIASSDIPMASKVGDYVSIFQLHDVQNGEEAVAPKRILSGVFISDLNRKGSNFGNTITLTISLDQSQVPILLAASSKGRLVVVGKDG